MQKSALIKHHNQHNLNSILPTYSSLPTCPPHNQVKFNFFNGHDSCYRIILYKESVQYTSNTLVSQLNYFYYKSNSNSNNKIVNNCVSSYILIVNNFIYDQNIRFVMQCFSIQACNLYYYK